MAIAIKTILKPKDCVIELANGMYDKYNNLKIMEHILYLENGFILI